MAVESPFLAAVIGHSEIAAFAADSINLRTEDVEDYREQVRLLREKLDRYAADHEEHGLIKTLQSGSLAKGTARKTLNDIDIAFYVEGNFPRRIFETPPLVWCPPTCLDFETNTAKQFTEESPETSCNSRLASTAAISTGGTVPS